MLGHELILKGVSSFRFFPLAWVSFRAQPAHSLLIGTEFSRAGQENSGTTGLLTESASRPEGRGGEGGRGSPLGVAPWLVPIKPRGHTSIMEVKVEFRQISAFSTTGKVTAARLKACSLFSPKGFGARN